MIIDLPVRLTSNFEIVDKNGQIVFPCITWKSDIYHLSKQRERGQMVVDKLNGRGSLTGHLSPSFSSGSESLVKEEIKAETDVPVRLNAIVEEVSSGSNGEIEGSVAVFEDRPKRRGMPKGGWPKK